MSTARLEPADGRHVAGDTNMRRRGLMRWTALGAATFMGGLLLQRNRVPSVAAQSSTGLVGGWTVVDESNGSLLVLTATADGNLIFTRGPLAPAPAIPNFKGAYLAYSASQGIWSQTADQEFAFTVVSFSYDDEGSTIGKLTLNGQVTLDNGGQGGSGPYNYIIAAVDGTVIMTGASTLTLTRIGLQP